MGPYDAIQLGAVKARRKVFAISQSLSEKPQLLDLYPKHTGSPVMDSAQSAANRQRILRNHLSAVSSLLIVISIDCYYLTEVCFWPIADVTDPVFPAG